MLAVLNRCRRMGHRAIAVVASILCVSVAGAASFEDRKAELENGYSGGFNKVRIEGNFKDPASAQARANQLRRELTNPLLHPSYSRADHGVKSYTKKVKGPLGQSVNVPMWLAYARVSYTNPFMGGTPKPTLRRTEFHTSGGSRFIRGSGAGWTEYRPNGPNSTFREVSRTETNDVVLFDAGRNMYVMLTASRGLWRKTPSEQWRAWPSSDGRWVK